MGATRTPFPNHQRAALRAWFQAQRPRPTISEAIAWFQDRYKHKLSKSTVSESLGDKYLFLDIPLHAAQARETLRIENSRNPKNPEVLTEPKDSRLPKSLTQPKYRQRASEWPELEQILIQWHRAVEEEGGSVTGDLIREKAKEIWQRIPSYRHQLPPKFSSGWLDKFKARHRLHQHTLHGEANGVPEEAAKEMDRLLVEARGYHEEDIYNMDETGLFWRLSPSTGLSSQKRSGIKKEKTRISIALCCNATGTDRLPPLVIGRARIPHALRGVHIETLGVNWRWNTKAWMTGPIMKEWLKQFYAHVGDRRTLLLLDNFSAHNTGLEMAPPPDNVKILFLPKNATSRYQPLDQGIIQNFKVYYRKQWLQYMVRCWEERKDPVKEVTIRSALRWIVQAWQDDISTTTIRNCYTHSTVLPLQHDQFLPAISIPDIYTDFLEAQQAGNIQDRMTLANFLNPENEQEDGLPEDPMEAALVNVLGDNWNSQGTQGTQGTRESQESQEPQEDDDIQPTRPPPTVKEALECCERLTEWIESRIDGRTDDVRSLARIQRAIYVSYKASMRQGTMDGWLRAA